MANDVLIDMLASVSLDSGVVTSSADPRTGILSDSTKNWAADKFKHCVVRIVDGKGAGQLVRITGNSADSLLVSPSWIVGLDTSSIYVIYQPEVSEQVDRILADVSVLFTYLTAGRTALLDRLALLAAGGAGELTPGRATNLDNLDALISSRAIPGDAMALTAAERLIVQALILSDAVPFAGALIDAAISTRALEDGGRLQNTESAVAGKSNVQDVVIYPVAEDAGTDELADDGSAPAYYPAVAHSTVANAEGIPGVAWSEDIDFEQEGNINVIAIYAEFEWRTRFLVGAGAGTQSSSKIQVSRDGGTNWVDLTDNFDHGAAVMTNRNREGVGRWIGTLVAGANQLMFRLVHWTDDAGGVSTSEAQIRSNSFVRITYRKE